MERQVLVFLQTLEQGASKVAKVAKLQARLKVVAGSVLARWLSQECVHHKSAWSSREPPIVYASDLLI